MDTADVVKDLAVTGSAHFHASYVAKQLGIPTAQAHKELADLQRQGILEVHFDVICPETDRTIKSYKLKEEVPLGEMLIEETGDCEPFELQESDLIVTYSPTQTYQRRLLREGAQAGSKKKDLAVPADLEDRLSKAAPWGIDPDSKQIIYVQNLIVNSPGTQIAQAERDSAAVVGDDSQGAAGQGKAIKGAAGAGKWAVVVVVLLIAIAVFGALYLTDTIKIEEAGIGVAFVGTVATVLALLK